MHTCRRQPGAPSRHLSQPVPEGAGARECLLQGGQGLEVSERESVADARITFRSWRRQQAAMLNTQVLRARRQRGADNRRADARDVALPGTGQGLETGPQKGNGRAERDHLLVGALLNASGGGSAGRRRADG